MIRNHLAFALGKMNNYKAFPAVYNLMGKLYCSDKAIAVLSQLGIESLAGINFILPVYLQNRLEKTTYPWISNYFYKLPKHCIAVTCNGIGIFVPFIPFQIQNEYLSIMDPVEMLPLIKEALKKVNKAP